MNGNNMKLKREEFKAEVVGSTILFGIGTCVMLFSLIFGISGINLNSFERIVLIGGALFFIFFIIKSGFEFYNYYSKKIILDESGITGITFKKSEEFLKWDSINEIIVTKPGGGITTAIKIASNGKSIYIVSFQYPEEFGIIKDCLKERADNLRIQFSENIKVKSTFAF